VEEKAGVISGFSLSIQQSTTKGGQVYRSVTLKAYNYEITMRPGVVWEVLVWFLALDLSNEKEALFKCF
jgi:hypothetical protein